MQIMEPQPRSTKLRASRPQESLLTSCPGDYQVPLNLISFDLNYPDQFQSGDNDLNFQSAFSANLHQWNVPYKNNTDEKMANELGLVIHKQPVAILLYDLYEVSTQFPNTKHL